MSDRLVIFCTSTRPDAYVNVILHGAISMGFREFLLVAVDDLSEPRGRDAASRLFDEMSSLINRLRGGVYTVETKDRGLVSSEPLIDAGTFSDTIATSNWDALEIGRRGLKEDELLAFLQEEITRGSSFDVTSCKNSLVAGIAAALVARGKSEIYSFELLKPPTFGAGDLLPALKPSDYAYRRLSDAPLMRDSLTRISRFSLSRKRFLLAAFVIAVIFAFLSVAFSQTAVFSLLTGFASFASISSAVGVFTRD